MQTVDEEPTKFVPELDQPYEDDYGSDSYGDDDEDDDEELCDWSDYTCWEAQLEEERDQENCYENYRPECDNFHYDEEIPEGPGQLNCYQTDEGEHCWYSY